jgi:hypothetical protein
MIEVTGNLWTYPADVRVITTNGTVRSDGACVMGRGCALEATRRYPGINFTLGQALKRHGNHVHVLARTDVGLLVSFPVKHHWREKADLELIRRSAVELVKLTKSGDRVVLPRPGCGNGHLEWVTVKPILEPLMDNRFHVITFGESR